MHPLHILRMWFYTCASRDTFRGLVDFGVVLASTLPGPCHLPPLALLMTLSNRGRTSRMGDLRFVSAFSVGNLYFAIASLLLAGLTSLLGLAA